jgi:deoxyribodipyrimidine photo-lyase
MPYLYKLPLSLPCTCIKYVTIATCFLQSATYDPEGEYVSHWLPSLKPLPPKQRNSPGLAYLKPIVPLKFGMGGGGGKPKNYARFGNKNKSVGKVSRR